MDNSRLTSEDQTASPSVRDLQPPPVPNKFWKTFLKKTAIAARLLGKESYRKKLRWFDLRRADYRLGKKAYDSRVPLPDQSRIIDRLSKIHHRIEVLGQPVNSGPSFKEKLIGAVKGVGRAMKIQILRFRRNRLFRKLGGQVRQNPPIDASFSSEIESSKAIFARIQSVNADIK